MTLRALYLSALAIFALPAQSWAEDNIAFLGVSGTYYSEYLGSADQDFRILPYLSVNNFKGFDVFGPQITYRLIDTGTGEGFGKWSLRAGPSIAYQIGRDNDDSPNFANFDDIDGSLPIGGYARATIGPVGLRVDAGQDIIGGHDGFTADASIGTFYSSGIFNIQPSVSLNWADAGHNQAFFGITAQQAAASPFQQVGFGSGAYSYSANVVTWLEFDNEYAVTLIGSYRDFIGDVTDSPILQAEDGATDGFSLALSLSRKFDLSKF